MSVIRIFVSYSHKDCMWVQEGPFGLIPWLADSLRREKAKFWYDPELKKLPGEKYKDRISNEIENADLAVLLISQDFINSDFIRDFELAWIKKEVDGSKLSIIPILIGPTVWEGEEEVKWLSERQMLPGKPTPLIDYTSDIVRWKHVQIEILGAIKKRIRQVREEKSLPRKPLPSSTTHDNVKPERTSTQRSESPSRKSKKRSDSEQKSPSNFASDPSKSSIPTQSPQKSENVGKGVVPTDIQAAVEKALAVIVIDRSGGWGASLRDKNSGLVWRKMLATYRGQEIPDLCTILHDPHCYWEKHWKAIKLLNHSVRTPEGKKMASEALAAICNWIGAGEYLQWAALEAVSQFPVPVAEKWSYLVTALQMAEERFTAPIIDLIPRLCPPEHAAQTGVIIVEILTYTTESSIMRTAVNALGKLDCRQETAKIREILSISDVNKAWHLTRLLTEWGDREAVPIIRGVIDRYRHGTNLNVCDLIERLYQLDAPSSSDYIAEVLLEAAPNVQLCLLKSTLLKIKEKAIFEAVEKLAKTTSNTEVKMKAGEFLARVKPSQ